MRRILAFLASAALLAGACSGFNPSSPSPVLAPPSAATGATITGSIGGGAAGASGSTAGLQPDAGPPAGIVVTVVGTSISATVGADGSFTLTNVPGGTLTLQFTGPGVQGAVTIANVVAGQTIELTLQLNGSVVALEAERRSSGNEEQLEGRIESMPPVTPPGTIVVAGRTVVTDSETRILQGNTPLTFADLELGQRVHVMGHAGTDSLLASVIMLQNTITTTPVIVNGVITELGAPFGPAAFTFMVGDTEVQGDSSTEFFGNSAFADLEVGARVHVQGEHGNGFVQARRIHVSRPDDDDDDDDDDETAPVVQTTGPVSELGGTCPARTFSVGGQAFRTTGATVFVGTTCAGIAAGQNVTATGTLTGAGFAIATQVTAN